MAGSRVAALGIVRALMPGALVAPLLGYALAATQHNTQASSKIFFAEPIHDCGRANAGQMIKWSFIFTNAGDQPLDVAAVRPGCGCATAGDWSRRVLPGRSGVIPIQLATALDWPSGPFDKTVTADSNDPRQPATVLHLVGTLWKPIDVTPQIAGFNIPADSTNKSSTLIRIVNNSEERLVLSQPEINGSAFAAELKTNAPGKDFRVIVTARPPFAAGILAGQLRLKTSSSVMPEILVPIQANILPVIVVLPPQITLPAAPLGRRSTPAFTIQYNATNTLSLTEAAVDAKGVAVAITETEPGHTFTVKLSFPQDFTVPRGRPVTFTVKTSYPGLPVLKVPIAQIPAASGRN